MPFDGGTMWWSEGFTTEFLNTEQFVTAFDDVTTLLHHDMTSFNINDMTSFSLFSRHDMTSLNDVKSRHDVI